jgi:short-subunit dehydrogenase
MGATSGIGLRLAECYASLGWRVGVAGRNENVLKSLKDRFPRQVEWEKIDINRNDAPTKLIELIGKMGGMEIYLHVSGVGYENLELDIDRDVEIATTNVVGFTRMIDAAYHYFRKAAAKGHRGHIAAITSVAGTKGIGSMAAYSASKRYQYTYLQAIEQLANMDKVKLDITDIRPGWVETPLLNDGSNYPLTMKLDKVSPIIMKAINKKMRIAVVDWRWATAVFFWRLIPGCLWVKIPYKP